MTWNEFLNDEKYSEERANHIQYVKNLYYSNTGYFLRKSMEEDDFINEVYIMIIQYWNFDNFNQSLRTYLQRVTNNTLRLIYRNMDLDKNRINYDDSLERIDKETEEDEPEVIIPTKDELFVEVNCIDYILEGIDNKLNKEILKLYLLGYQLTTIQRTLNLTRSKVRWIISKYDKVMKDRFNDYRNNI